jgi:hypothetical protein
MLHAAFLFVIPHGTTYRYGLIVRTRRTVFNDDRNAATHKLALCFGIGRSWHVYNSAKRKSRPLLSGLPRKKGKKPLAFSCILYSWSVRRVPVF